MSNLTNVILNEKQDVIIKYLIGIYDKAIGIGTKKNSNQMIGLEYTVDLIKTYINNEKDKMKPNIHDIYKILVQRFPPTTECSVS